MTPWRLLGKPSRICSALKRTSHLQLMLNKKLAWSSVICQRPLMWWITHNYWLSSQRSPYPSSSTMGGGFLEKPLMIVWMEDTFFTSMALFRLVNRLLNVFIESFVKPRPTGNWRGHRWRSYKPQAITSWRASEFHVRSGSPWKALLDDVVSATSLAAYKTRLNASWSALDLHLFSFDSLF